MTRDAPRGRPARRPGRTDRRWRTVALVAVALVAAERSGRAHGDRHVASGGIPVERRASVLSPAGPRPRLEVAPLPDGHELVAELAWVTTLDGERVGTFRQRTSRAPDGSVLTEIQGVVRLARGDRLLESMTSNGVLEDADERPLLFWDEHLEWTPTRDDSRRATWRRTEWRVAADGVAVRHVDADGVHDGADLPPLPDGVLGFEAARRLLAARLAAGADRVERLVVAFDAPRPWRHEVLRRVGPARIKVSDRTVDGTRLRDIGPPPSELVVDEGGWTVANTGDLPIGPLCLTMVDPDDPALATEFEPPTLLGSSLVHPRGGDRLPVDPRRTARARFRVVHPTSIAGLPALGAQTVSAGPDPVENDPARAVCTAEVVAGRRSPTPVPDAADLAPSRLIDRDHPAITDFAAEALAGAGAVDAPDGRRAIVLRDAVRAHLAGGDHGLLFTPASTTLRAGAGDCSEHAVLLAALLRAADIPARVAVGIVVPDRGAAAERPPDALRMPWHMWTLAWTPEGWLDLDAAFDAPSRPSTDAARLAVFETSLADGRATAELTRLLLVVGGLDVEIVDAMPIAPDAGPPAPGRRNVEDAGR